MGRRDMLINIATEELSHLEVIGTIVAMLNRGAKGRLSEASESEAELYRSISGGGNDSHVTQILYGGGPPIVYERLINCTDDRGVKDALGFLMTREISHQQSFEKALYSMQPNFPPGKLQGKPEFANVYFNMSPGDGNGGAAQRGPWNSVPTFDYREANLRWTVARACPKWDLQERRPRWSSNWLHARAPTLLAIRTPVPSLEWQGQQQL